jgi:hypothetical protein
MPSSPLSSRERKLQRTVGILIFLIFLLIGLVAIERLNPKFFSFGANQETFIKDAKDRLDSISNQLEVRMIQIKKLGGRVNELEAARQQILGDQKAISENPEIGQIEIQRKLAYYLRLIGQKDLEIKKLRKENFVLLARNDSLSREAKILQDGLSNVQKALRDSSLTFGVKQKELSERSRILEVRNQEMLQRHYVRKALMYMLFRLGARRRVRRIKKQRSLKKFG